jgi:uncharacterized protein YbjT (DUF2867 family)
MSRITIFGASGQVGHYLLPELGTRHSLVAVSRAPRIAESPWLCADINDERVNWPAADSVISLGPLDAFAAWLDRYRGDALRRVIALSSMSAESKIDSPDPAERDLAGRLNIAEVQVTRRAEASGIALTLFRPTLIYGAGSNSLSRIAAFARRWHVLPVPLGARGLRQPVHARDLARACVAALDNARTYGKIYPLGGGERLRFDEMLARLYEALGGRAVRLPVPLPVLSLAARWRPAGGLFSAAAVARLREPLIADNSAAQRDFGYAPGAFDAGAALPD